MIFSGFGMIIDGGAGGCAGAGRDAAPAAASPGPTRSELLGDWDDVKPSVGTALSQVGIASVRVDGSDPARLVYTLRTPRDEPGNLTLERLSPVGEPDPVRIGVTCSIGRFGDPSREGELVRRIDRRLEQLRGVEIAPVRR